MEALSQWQQEEDYAFQLVGLVGDIKDTDPADKIAYTKDLTSHLPHSFPQLLANDSLSPFLTTINGAEMAVGAIAVKKKGDIGVKSMQEYHKLV